MIQMSKNQEAERGPRSREEARRWARESADAMSDEETAALEAAALNDPENPPTDGLVFRRARGNRSLNTRR